MRKHVNLARVAAALVLTTAPTSTATAQSTPRDSVVLHALSQFAVDDRIRVALLRSPFTGRYVGTRGDTLFFGTPGEPPMAFRLNAVDSLWRFETATRRGATLGALFGTIAVGGMFMLSESEKEAGTLIRAALLGGLAGGSAGALIGSGLRRWRLVFGDARPQGF